MKSNSVLGMIHAWHEAGAFADRTSEEVLARFAATRDESAFREVMRRHAGHVWAVCRRELTSPDLAEDAFQATFVALARRAGQVGRKGTVAGWLDTTARRTAIKVRVKESRQADVEARRPVEPESDAPAEESARSEQVRAALADLPDPYRLALTYRYLAGLSPADVAKSLGLKDEAGKKRLKRGLDLLREKLASQALAAATAAIATESALQAAREPVPLVLFAATLKAAVKAEPVRIGVLVAVTSVLTYKRAVVGMVLIALGMTGALVHRPARVGGPGTVSNTAGTPKVDPMRNTPLLALMTILGLTPATPAQQFTRIVRTSDPIPGGTGNFAGFVGSGLTSNQVAAGGGNIIFGGVRFDGQQGFYTSTPQGLVGIVNTDTPIPTGTGNFTTLAGSISVTSTSAAFIGHGSDGQFGLYAAPVTGGPLVKLMDRNTPMPTGGNFGGFQQTGFRTIQIAGTSVAFLGSATGGGGAGENGIYLAPLTGGTIIRVYDTSAPIPNSAGNFTEYQHFHVSGTSVAFIGGLRSGTTVQSLGVYTGTITGGPLKEVASLSTNFPGAGSMTAFMFVATNGNKVALGANNGNGGTRGIYTASMDGSALTRIADNNTMIPGRTETFQSFDRPAVNDSIVAFSARSASGYNGIFTAPIGGGPLTKIVGTGDVLDGRTVASFVNASSPLGVALGTQGVDGSMFAFSVNFTDGTQAVYTFTPVPEPATTGLAAAVGVALLALGRWVGRF